MAVADLPPWLVLLGIVLSFSCGGTGVPVYLENIVLYKTHDWVFSRPEVYFQCEGEEKKFLTGVVEINKVYNFSFHESFQPMTELDAPKCKRCGLFERDIFTEDDVFDRFELCPLDFSEPPGGQLLWDSPHEMNITFKCPNCNTRNSFAGGVIFSPATSTTANYLFIFSVVLGTALSISLLVVVVSYGIKEGRLPCFDRQARGDAKFMEIFDDEDDDFLDEHDVELAEQHQDGKND